MTDEFLVYNSSYNDENCWKYLYGVENEAPVDYDPEYLQRLRIFTVFIVCLCGSSLVVLLLICACLSSQTFIDVILKKKVKLPHKGIEGKFPFLLSHNRNTDDQHKTKSDISVNSGQFDDVMEACVTVEIEADNPGTGGFLSGRNGMYGFTPPRYRTDTIATSAGEGSLASFLADESAPYIDSANDVSENSACSPLSLATAHHGMLP